MLLNTSERLIIISILPKEGDFTTIKIIRNLKENLSFSEEEHKLLQFKKDDVGITWNPEGNIPKDIEFGDVAKQIISEQLKTFCDNLSEQGKMTEEFLLLYEKFIIE